MPQLAPFCCQCQANMYIEWFVCHIDTLFTTMTQAYIYLAVTQLNIIFVLLNVYRICYDLSTLLTQVNHLPCPFTGAPDSERIIILPNKYLRRFCLCLLQLYKLILIKYCMAIIKDNQMAENTMQFSMFKYYLHHNCIKLQYAHWHMIW